MKPKLKRAARVSAALIALIVVMIFGWRWLREGWTVATTDNAYVHSDATAIAAKVPGYVVRVRVGDNQIVRAGETLAEIDPMDYATHVAQAEAALAEIDALEAHLGHRAALQQSAIEEAAANVALVGADRKLAAQEYSRAATLVGDGATSRSDYDTASAAKQRAQAAGTRAAASVQTARHQLAAIRSEAAQLKARRAKAEADLKLARIALSDTIIVAPVDGVVGNRRLRAGEFIRPGSTLMTVVPVRSSWIVANFKETQLRDIRIGQRVSVEIDGYPGGTLKGTVDSLAPASGAAFSLLPPDNATGNFVRIVQRVPVKIRLDPKATASGRIVPGLSARVQVDLGSAPAGSKGLAESFAIAKSAR